MGYLLHAQRTHLFVQRVEQLEVLAFGHPGYLIPSFELVPFVEASIAFGGVAASADPYRVVG